MNARNGCFVQEGMGCFTKYGLYCALFTFLTMGLIIAHAGEERFNKGLQDVVDDGEVEIFEEASPDSDEIFVPTDEWQVVKEGQKIPKGLHVRINLQTGMKEAKLMADEEGTTDVKESIDLSLREHERSSLEVAGGVTDSEDEEDPVVRQKKATMRAYIVKALKNIKSEDGKTPEESSQETKERVKKFRSYDELKKEFGDLNLQMETDTEIMQRLITDYLQTHDEEEQLTILEDLDYLLHQIDNAINFVDIGGLRTIILPGINSSNINIKMNILKILGSSSQSNPKVQIAALEAGLLSHIIRLLAVERDPNVSTKAVFALSCLIRGFPYGQQVLLESGGLAALRGLLNRKDFQSLSLQLKVISLIESLQVERLNAEGERARQFARVDLAASLVSDDWCPAIASLLAAASFDRRGIRQDLGSALSAEMPLRPDHDTVDKVVSAMGSLVPACGQQFSDALPLLRSLSKTYADLAYKEKYQGDDGHDMFQHLANQIDTLVKHISSRDEL